MNYYAIQVRTRSEEKFIKLYKTQYPDSVFKIHFPRRRLNIRKEGKIKPATPAVFPGYLFIESLNEEDIIFYQRDFRKTEGFYRFLKSNREITPLANKDLETVLHFINIGPVAGVSKVSFDENSRITVLEGPLSGFEGNIIKVDKRKRRAKIQLDMFDDSFTIDLAFEIIGSI